MKDKDIKFLEESGWQVDCESPFEISLIDEPSSHASGYYAEIILEYEREQWTLEQNT